MWLGLHLARTVLHRDITMLAFSLLAQMLNINNLENISQRKHFVAFLYYQRKKRDEYNRVQIPWQDINIKVNSHKISLVRYRCLWPCLLCSLSNIYIISCVYDFIHIWRDIHSNSRYPIKILPSLADISSLCSLSVRSGCDVLMMLQQNILFN